MKGQLSDCKSSDLQQNHLSIPNDQFERCGFAPNFANCANKFCAQEVFYLKSEQLHQI
jgi:hypothetical protein